MSDLTEKRAGQLAKAMIVTGLAFATAGWLAGGLGLGPARTSAVAAAAGTGGTRAGAQWPAAHPPWTPIGYSVQGRPILAASFGLGRRAVLLVGGVHGNEFGADVAESFATYLAGHPEAVPAGMRVDVIACADPDGRAAGRRGNAHAVDLNRNFPARGWTRDQGGTVATAGPYPASEPETRVLVAYLERGYTRVVSLHSAGGIVDYDGPGGRALADTIGRASGLPVIHLGQEARYTGSMGRYVPQRYGIPVITIELERRTMTARILAGLLAASR